jgi:hypothetical protein
MLLLLDTLSGVVLGWECAGGGGTWCVGPSLVQQCVDGRPMGLPVDCGAGFVCDSANQWGPCVPQPQDACCGEGLFPVKGKNLNILHFFSQENTKLYATSLTI